MCTQCNNKSFMVSKVIYSLLNGFQHRPFRVSISVFSKLYTFELETTPRRELRRCSTSLCCMSTNLTSSLCKLNSKSVLLYMQSVGPTRNLRHLTYFSPAETLPIQLSPSGPTHSASAVNAKDTIQCKALPRWRTLNLPPSLVVPSQPSHALHPE